MKKNTKKKQLEPERPKRVTPVPRYLTDPHMGLTEMQAMERKGQGWANDEVKAESKTIGQIVKQNTFTYFNLIFAVLSLVLILVGDFRDLTFLPIIIANTLIGIIQQIRSKKTLDKLSILDAPTATVIREGKKKTVRTTSLVLDDMVLLSAGQQIPADAILEDGHLTMNESLLTGEAESVPKEPGDTLMSGSFVVSGTAIARLDKVGADSYISRLTMQAKEQSDEEHSEMLRSLNWLVRIVGFLLIPIGIILFVEQHFLLGDPIRTAVPATVAALIGMIPEGLFLLASVALALSVMRLAQKKVLVREFGCIETLAQVDVLCLDKTGTITENVMEVSKTEPLCSLKKKEIELLLGDFAAASSPDSSTMEAMQRYYLNTSGARADRVIGFQSAYKYSAVEFDGEWYVLGAPEFLLGRNYKKYSAQIEKFSSKGFRTVLFGISETPVTGEKLTEPVEPVALVLLRNPVREHARETLSYFAEQGVTIKIISGDHPVTVSEIAKEAGVPDADLYVDASTLQSQEEIDRAVEECTVFGRVTPKQKCAMIESLQKQGHKVAMTGDGVNDVLALKKADCSIAMAQGSEAASRVSQLVLMESDFSRLPHVVAEGRRVVNNIQRSSSLFLVKNIFSLCMALFSIIYMSSYPITPSQISFISAFTIGAPAFLFALEPNYQRPKGRFLLNILLTALPAGLTDFIVVGLLVMFGEIFGVASADISTAATLLLAIVGLMILFRIGSPMNKLRLGVWFAMLAGLLVGFIFFRDFFGISPMTQQGWLLLVVLSIITEPLLRYLCQFFNWLLKKLTAWDSSRRRKA